MSVRPIARLALGSLRNRALTGALTVFAIAVSVTLLLGVEKVRNETKASFAGTISGTDLIVGARSGAVQLLLYSVFRIGNATNNISWRSYQEIAARPEVAWTIPISLGDSHRGYRLLGTSRAYFEHYRHGRGRPLAFAAGAPFDDVFGTVLGADVAKALDYRVGDAVAVDHGLGQIGFASHKDKPFTVVGILAKTGTPVDRTVHVSLEGIEAIHVDWQGGARIPGMTVTADEVRRMELRPKAVTAILVGLKSKFAIFGLQRAINEHPREPLLAILPGVALQELWSLMGTAETALGAISVSVVVAGLLGMLTMLLAGLNERRREMAVLRAVGARPVHVFGMLIAESVALTALGVTLSLVLLYAGLAIAQPIVDREFGLFISIGWPSSRDLMVLGLVLAAGFVAGLVPAYRSYRYSVSDGMIPHV